MTKLNGRFIFGIKKYILNNYGKEAFNELLKNLSKEEQDIYSSPILSSEWYDLELYDKLAFELKNKYSDSDLEEFVKFQAKDTMKSFYGFILNLISFDMLLKAISFMWNKTYSEGRVYIKDKSEDKIIFRTEDVKLSDNHKTLLELYIKTLGEISKKKEVKVISHRIDETTIDFEVNFS